MKAFMYFWNSGCAWDIKREFRAFSGDGSFDSPFTFGSGEITLREGGNYYIIVDDPDMPQPSQDEFPDNSKFIQIPRTITNVNNYII